MEHSLHLRLENANQRDAPLSSKCENYSPPTTLAGTLKSCTIWKYIIFGCFQVFSLVIVMILLPIIGRQYFDEDNDDTNSNCDSGSYSRYAFWYSISKCSTGFVALMSQSYIGRLSDALGRKPFLYIAWFCQSLPVIPLCFTNNVWWYFAVVPIAGFAGMTASMPTILQAAISDVTAPQFRTAVYGVVFGFYGIALLVASVVTMIIVNHWGITYAFYTCVGTNIIALLFLIFVMDESLKKSNRKPLDDDINNFAKHEEYLITQQIELNKIGIDISNGSVQYDQRDNHHLCVWTRCCHSKHNPLKPLCYINKNKIILWMAIASVLTAFPETGVNELNLIYVSDNLGLCDEKENSRINSYLMISMASFMIFSQLIILPILSTFMNDIKLICIGVTVMLLSFLLGIVLYFVPTTIVALLLQGSVGMSVAIIPTLSGALTKRISPREQGVALGVIHAIKGLNACISPFVFAYLYWFFSQELDNVGVFISMPYLLGAVIVVFVYPIIWCPLKKIFAEYDEYAFKASVVPFDNNPDGNIPPQQLL